MNCISKEIERIKKLLAWEVQIVQSDKNEFKIVSNAEQKLHEITVFDEEDYTTEIVETLHEYVHAWHHEYMPYEFSSNDYIGNVPLNLSTDSYEVKYILCSARDWFVAGHIVEACKSEYLEYVINTFNKFSKLQSEASSENDNIILGLVCAEASKWLNKQPFEDKKVIKYTSEFLKIDPYEPTVQSMYELTKGLFKVENKYNIQLVNNGSGVDWKIDYS